MAIADKRHETPHYSILFISHSKADKDQAHRFKTPLFHLTSLYQSSAQKYPDLRVCPIYTEKTLVIYIISRYYICVIEFEWDEQKNKKNRKKHGVWFEEAKQVFDDQNAIEFYDDSHSMEEDRFIMLGMSASSRTLVVVFCERNHGNKIRIISAREATKKERKKYEEGI